MKRSRTAIRKPATWLLLGMLALGGSASAAMVTFDCDFEFSARSRA